MDVRARLLAARQAGDEESQRLLLPEWGDLVARRLAANEDLAEPLSAMITKELRPVRRSAVAAGGPDQGLSEDGRRLLAASLQPGALSGAQARRRSTRPAMVIIVVLLVIIAFLITSQRSTAEHQRDQAIYDAAVAEALQLETTDASLAAQLNLAAYASRPSEGFATRLVAAENTPLSIPLASQAGGISSVAFSPGGGVLAGGGSNGLVRLWDVADPAHPGRYAGR